MFSFNQAVGFILRREVECICIAFLTGENQKGDVLCLSVNGTAVTLPAKIDTGNQPLNVV